MDKTLIIVGAGMSKSLGLPTTSDIYNTLKILLDEENYKSPSSLRQRLARIKEANVMFLDECAEKDFVMALSMLFDGNGARTTRDANECCEQSLSEYCSLYQKYFPSANIDALRHHLRYTFKQYSLTDLKAIMYSLKESSPVEKISLIKILTTINKAIESNIAIPTNEIFPDEKKETRQLYYCDRNKLDGALNTYKLLVYKLFKHLLRNMNTSLLSKYEDFFIDWQRIFQAFIHLMTWKNLFFERTISHPLRISHITGTLFYHFSG